MPTDPLLISVILSAGFVGGLVRGYSGFGFAMASVPILSIGLAPALAVPAVLVHEFAIGLFSLRAEREAIRSKLLLLLGLGSLLGTPVGIAILSSLPDRVMRVGIALALILSVLALSAARRRPIGLGRGVVGAAGFASGVLNGATAMSGPPAVLVLLGSALPPRHVRGLLICFIVFSAATGIILTLAGGLQTRASLGVALIMAPGVLAGALSGAAAFRHLPHTHYRAISMIGLLVIAVGTLAIALSIP